MNEYAAIVVSPSRHPHVNRAGAETFAAWLGSPEARALVDGFRIDGERAFHTTPEDAAPRSPTGASGP